ncbi:hypothetical protein ACVWYQ_006406 [Bradyrhizobium sp. USDA 3397]
MSYDANALYQLLPAIHRLRDAEQGGALRDLIAVFAEQVAEIEEDLAQLYDDQFIETCADWVAPYLGSLIGYQPLHHVIPELSSPRTEVANTVAYRRRKGTATTLEQVARDATNWGARVVELFERVATTQYLNHLRPHSTYTLDLRNWEALERAGTAFDQHQHSIDVRSIARKGGRYNIPNVGLFLWRLLSYPLRRATALRVDDRRFLFNPLGIDAPLFTKADPEEDHLATPLNVPLPISRRVLAHYLDLYYGPDKSLLIEVRSGPGQALTTIPASEVQVCNLSTRTGGAWSLASPAKRVAIDPVLGRLLFRDAQPPEAETRVSFHYGFSAPMGAGQYDRADFLGASAQPITRVSEDSAQRPTIQSGLDEIASTGGICEIADSRTYAEAITVKVPAGKTVILRAANRQRPTINLSGDLTVKVNGTGGEARCILDGLVLAGRPVFLDLQAKGLKQLLIRHCTLVPGRTLAIDGTPQSSDPSLIADVADTEIVIERTIIGGLRSSVRAQTVVKDSIVDATSPSSLAYAGTITGPDGRVGNGGPLRLDATTVIGHIFAEAFELITNCIVLADAEAGTTPPPPIRAARLQNGCVRFSFVSESAVTPRRFQCQPDHEISAQIRERELATNALVKDGEAASVRTAVQAWLRPSFTSLRYGRPGYGQLGRSCPTEIVTGAEDEAEMGAFHVLLQPQRQMNLDVRVEEYLRFGLEAGVFFET